jgi:hypothetical protein
LPVDVNLKRCQRYYQVLSPGVNQAIVQYQGGFRTYNQTFMTEMRTTPSFTTDTFEGSGFTAFDGSDVSKTGCHAYKAASSTNTTSMSVRGVRFNAEL